MMDRVFPALNSSGRVFDLPIVEQGLSIPKYIHHISTLSKVLTPELQENAEKIKALNPDWKYTIYDDDDIRGFIREIYGVHILSYYDRINPHYGAARADLFRYLLMYKQGGVYMDVKSTCTLPFDQILRSGDRYLLSQWRNRPGELHEGWGTKGLDHINGGEYQQWHIIAAPGHPFLRAVIQNVLNNIDQYRPWAHGTGASGVLHLTGPIAYTLAIQPLISTCEYRLVKNETALGLQYSIFGLVAHKNVFKSHYSYLTESIVMMKGAGKFAANFLSFAKKTKRRIFGISNGKSAR